ncbi:BA75_04540T0 [Komagataella pastoris]|uniref:BA75_04540T0 n=1 Tax=Komagataella pastoris TaxID=4922 RepID=A0A1B2JH43_PICPA|nr:BA75_04540T0 [Komagataella pastoris]
MAVPNTPPRGIQYKKSIPILANNNGLLNSQPATPITQRQVSESTGLVKFSIGKNAASPVKDGLPMYLPLKSAVHEDKENDILFQLAKKQRQVVDLTQTLEIAKQELAELERKYQSEFNSRNPSPVQKKDQNPPTAPKNPLSELKRIMEKNNEKKPSALKSKKSLFNLQQDFEDNKAIQKIRTDFTTLSSNFLNDSKKFQQGFVTKANSFFNNFNNPGSNSIASDKNSMNDKSSGSYLYEVGKHGANETLMSSEDEDEEDYGGKAYRLDL